MGNQKIDLEPVTSSNLAAYGYDGAKKILAVEFKNGHIYHYADVPPETALGFLNADSKGSFYGKMIRGKFTGQKMTGRCPKCEDAPGWIGDVCADCGTATYADERPADMPAPPLDPRD